MRPTYPTSLNGIDEWAAANGTKVGEAKFRFAQSGVLQAIADSRTLSRILAFKGGNALDFVWLPNRSTRDLDFSATDSTLTAEKPVGLLAPSLALVSRRTGVLYRVQRIRQQPPGPNRTFITFEGKIGYALPEDRHNTQLIERGQSSKAVVPVEVSLNEPICGTEELDIGGSNPVRVCRPEDIVAEKLRALLQQPLRNRNRPQDVLDICIAVREYPSLNLDLVAKYLLEKAAARNVLVSRAAFHQKEIQTRAAQGYNGLKETTRHSFPAFEEAFATVLDLVDRLHLPDTKQ